MTDPLSTPRHDTRAPALSAQDKLAYPLWIFALINPVIKRLLQSQLHGLLNRRQYRDEESSVHEPGDEQRLNVALVAGLIDGVGHSPPAVVPTGLPLLSDLRRMYWHSARLKPGDSWFCQPGQLSSSRSSAGARLYPSVHGVSPCHRRSRVPPGTQAVYHRAQSVRQSSPG